ncbi:IS66 family transposase zinc-finger binding domain-containing protein [bacterium]|nr:IS66 family transposase zinc-finger binding domain-containing protein [bacterium]
MTPPPCLPPDLFDSLPPAVQAYIRYLEARLSDLESRLGQNSTNSSKPPSSDPPHAKPAPPKTPTGKQKGGQPGHPRRTRPDLPPDVVVELRANTCDRCSHPLAGEDPAPLRHQVVEIPPVRPPVTEYRRHRLVCPRCGRVTCPALPAEARGGYGPRVQAVCALLAGAYRVAASRPVGDRPSRPATKVAEPSAPSPVRDQRAELCLGDGIARPGAVEQFLRLSVTDRGVDENDRVRPVLLGLECLDPLPDVLDLPLHAPFRSVVSPVSGRIEDGLSSRPQERVRGRGVFIDLGGDAAGGDL